MFAAAPDLVIVGRAGIGVDNIDIDAATDHGVIVANAPEGNVRAAAEHTVAMGFAAARSIPQAHARLKDGEWAKSDYLGNEVNGKTLGVVGLGRVGQQVAKRLVASGWTSWRSTRTSGRSAPTSSVRNSSSSRPASPSRLPHDPHAADPRDRELIGEDELARRRRLRRQLCPRRHHRRAGPCRSR